MTQQKNNNKSKTAANSYQDCLSKSLQAIQQGKFGYAIEWAEKAVKKNPTLAQGYNVLACAHEKNGDPDKALDIMLNNPSENKQAAYMLYCGELLLKKMAYEQAIPYFKESLLLQPAHNNARLGLAHCYRKLGNNVLAHFEFLEIKKERRLTSHENNVFIDGITNINFHSQQLDVLQEIDAVLSEDESIDKRKISIKVGELLVAAYPDLANTETLPLNHAIFTNKTFLSLLTKFPMANPHVDYRLTQSRKLLLLSIAESGEISDQNIEICKAFAQQNFLNEYIQYVTDDEQQLLKMFNELLINHMDQQGWQISDSEAIILVLLMYTSLDKLPEKLSSQLDLTLWPTSLWPFVNEQLINRATEIRLGASCPSLTGISSDTPASVRAQYEENPYPRWTECNLQRMNSLGQYIRGLMPDITLSEEFFNPNMRVLIAGCGTGKQAIESSFLYSQAKVTAFDISRRSLGYAQRMAKKLDVKNIEFFHGDILELSDSVGKFDLIECCGVLHHLAQPLVGWKNLTKLLKPKGIMRIDLYSRLARSEIISRRKQIAELNLQPSLETLRAFRHAVLAQNTDQFLLNLRDFHTTSEFRDLLFHQQEVQYDLDEIEQALRDLDLTFVAMHVNESKLAKFRQSFSDAKVSDLQQWKLFEQKYPQSFLGMYSFWCQNNH